MVGVWVTIYCQNYDFRLKTWSFIDMIIGYGAKAVKQTDKHNFFDFFGGMKNQIKMCILHF